MVYENKLYDQNLAEIYIFFIKKGKIITNK